jgi:dipeptidyl aminopeptidase/acylaminoacyl peptidase
MGGSDVKQIARGALALFAWALATGLATAARAAPPPERSPITTADLFRMKQVTSAAISPDGTSIACTIAVPRDPLSGKDGASWSELWVVGSDGRLRPFITGEVNVNGVQFTPNGKFIALLAKRGGDKQRSLHLLPIDGGEAIKAFEHDTDLGSVSFHPTLNRIAFLATPSDKKKKDAVEKGFSQEVFEEDWVAAKVFVADLDIGGSQATEVPVNGHPSDLRWSPDGKRLLMALAPNPGVDASYMRRRLHVIEAETGAVVTAVDHEGKLGMSTMSPNGRLIAFIGARDKHDPQQGRLMVANAAGGFTKELLPEFQGHFVSCAFLDDETLLYLADQGCETVIAQMKIDGTEHAPLPPSPGFTVNSMAVATHARRAAVIATTPFHAQELFALGEGGTATRLTDLNPWLAGRKFCAQEVVRWKARDGLEIEGLLIWPFSRKPGEEGPRVPLVVIVHGGPESHYRNGWCTRYSEPAQILAGRGYAVLLPNYRASTGRGVEFSMADHKDPAGKEFDDLVDGVDFLVAKGLVDGAKVGVTGGSYGGYASAWCATKHTDRFAAAVMGFGVANLLSMSGTSDIPEEHYLVHHRIHPWEDWQLFLERSPIFHAPKSRTPLLILAGKADPRVPPGQSIEMYRYLEQAGHKAVRLVQYPGEGHGNARAASRLDYHLRLLQWFDHYLKGQGGAPPPMELDYAAAPAS